MMVRFRKLNNASSKPVDEKFHRLFLIYERIKTVKTSLPFPEDIGDSCFRNLFLTKNFYKIFTPISSFFQPKTSGNLPYIVSGSPSKSCVRPVLTRKKPQKRLMKKRKMDDNGEYRDESGG